MVQCASFVSKAAHFLVDLAPNILGFNIFEPGIWPVNLLKGDNSSLFYDILVYWGLFCWQVVKLRHLPTCHITISLSPPRHRFKSPMEKLPVTCHKSVFSSVYFGFPPSLKTACPWITSLDVKDLTCHMMSPSLLCTAWCSHQLK